MSETFRDALRRAAGLHTTEEKRLLLEQQTLEAADWQRGGSARQQALDEYRRTVFPFIDRTLHASQEVAQEAKHTVAELTADRIPKQVLSKRSFVIREKNDISASGYLDILLDSQGMVSWSCEDHLHQTKAAAQNIPVDAVPLSEIERSFTELFKQVSHRLAVGTVTTPLETASTAELQS